MSNGVRNVSKPNVIDCSIENLQIRWKHLKLIREEKSVLEHLEFVKRKYKSKKLMHFWFRLIMMFRISDKSSSKRNWLILIISFGNPM
jgi:hypothetical protein